MDSRQTIESNVIDTNHQQRGRMNVTIEFYQSLPVEVTHDGKTYCYTGKTGTNVKTGLPVREMATADDARLWITLDGQQVWED